MRQSLLAAVVLVLLSAIVGAHSAPDQKELAAYLGSHWQSPEDYVVGAFARHDIVFLGEYHRIRHDAELVQALIPRLYRAGIYNLGFEFANFEDQPSLDTLLNAATYDEALARRILFRGTSYWGYKEYLDIYRAAWQLNHSLPPGAPRFRIVNLMYRANWPALQAERTPEVMKQVWQKGDPEVYMAEVVLTEFVARRQKALIYCGIHHAFTRYHQPVYNFQKKQLVSLNDGRLGNLVYKRIGGRAMTIYLHASWPSSQGWQAPEVRPVEGAIDRLMAGMKDTRVGFDLPGTPLGNLPATDTYYAFGYPDFKLSDFADGYIYQLPFRDYQGVTVDPLFITWDNLREAVAYISNPESRAKDTSPEIFLNGMRQDADMQLRFRHLR